MTGSHPTSFSSPGPYGPTSEAANNAPSGRETCRPVHGVVTSKTENLVLTAHWWPLEQ